MKEHGRPWNSWANLQKEKNLERKRDGFRPRMWEHISGQKQMKDNIHYSPEAQNDLDEIWEYITFELCNPQAAENSVNKIMDTVDELENFSEIGAPLSAVTDIESDYRFLTSGNYMVFYRVNGQDVYIDRVLYGRRDYLRILFPDLPQNDNEG